MTRWMFPYIGFMSMVALAAGVLNTWKNFAIPAATPVMLNVAMILCTLLLAPWFRRHQIEPIHALSVGVLLGGVLQLGLQLPALARLHTLPRLGVTPEAVRSAWHHPGVKRVLRQMAPALLGVSVAQVSLLINTQIASHLGPGAVSWLFYADRLMEFPTALLGVALGVVLIPGLSALRARGDLDGYSAQLDWGLRLVFMLALPCSMAMLCFAKPMVAVLFHHGKFSIEAVDMTVLALQGYGVGLIGIIAVKVLAPGFFAQQDLRTPVRIAIFVLVCTQVMNAVFVPWLGHAGLALSIGLGAIVNASWLLVGLRRKGIYKVSPGWGGFVLRLVPANLALAAWFLWVNHAVAWLDLQGHAWWRVGLLIGAIVGGAGVYFAVLFGSGIRRTDFVRSA
jgi:putative peptidoglycan lipid II flippase